MASDIEKQGKFSLIELSKHIKSQSSSEIISSLTCVKDDPQLCKHLVNNEGLEIFINLLKSSNNIKIQNLLFSILANACLSSEVRKKVRKTKLKYHILNILKNVQAEDNLQCRACRLIGNLSECHWHAKDLFNSGILPRLQEILQSKSTSQTHSMAIRAARNIWNNCNDSREKIIHSGLIKQVTKLFVSTERKDLLEACLKAMHMFSIGLNISCAEQLRGYKDSDGYQKLVHLIESNNKIAVKIFYNLVQVPESRPLLGNCGAVDVVTKSLNSKRTSSEFIISICFLCREAINRVRVRDRSGLEIILDLLRDAEYEKYHPMLLHALVQFIYDDDSILLMLKNGLLDILTKKLGKMVAEIPKESYELKTAVKRPGDSSCYKKMETKYNKTNYGRFSLDYSCDDWSPGSATSASSSPPGTPPMCRFGDFDELDKLSEENYSPVCSDADTNEEFEEVESLKGYSSTNIDAEDSIEAKKITKAELNEHINACTLALLYKLSQFEEPVDKLSDENVVKPLTTYAKYGNSSRAPKILKKIVKNRLYFMALLQQGFIFEIQGLSDSIEYSKPMCSIAENSHTIGELTSTLKYGNEDKKAMVAVSIPFLIKTKKILSVLLHNYSGLPMIFEILKNNRHNLYDKAVISICELAEVLQVKPDVFDKSQPADNVLGVDFNAVDIHQKPSTVRFELDDGTTVDACRRTLCQKSEAFSAMLEGNFCESGRRTVKLKNTSKEGLSTLLMAASGVKYSNRNIESLLDAVLLADKFLMAELSESLTETSLSILNYKNMSRAWSWARLNSCQELKSSCVKNFLTTKMTKSQRLHAFRDFSRDEHFLEFLSDVQEIIVEVLCQR